MKIFKDETIVSVTSGRIAIEYAGPGLSDASPELIERDITLTVFHPWRAAIYFDTAFPGTPLVGLQEFDLDDLGCDREDISIYRMDTVRISGSEFIMLLNYAWTGQAELVNFRAAARFRGPVPAGLPVTRNLPSAMEMQAY